MSYLSASAVVIHYEEALYKVYAPLPYPFYPQTQCHGFDLAHLQTQRHGVMTVSVMTHEPPSTEFCENQFNSFLSKLTNADDDELFY